MDSQFTGPFGVKFGLDGLLGFIPVIGDLSTGLISAYIIVQAAQSGCSRATLVRMAFNVVFDNLLDSVPILGNVADFFWRSNDRNIALLERHERAPQATSRQSWAIVLAVLVLVLGTLMFSVYLGVQVVRAVLVYLQNFNVNA